MNEYKPISCSFYDYLEAFAVKKIDCIIVFNESGKPEQTTGIITDLFSKNKIEYLLLDSGKTIRLDHLIKVNDIALNLFESC